MRHIRHIELGPTWIAALQAVCQHGAVVGDETWELTTLIASFTRADFDADPILARHALRDNVEEMRKVFFSTEPNRFGHSYWERQHGPRGQRDLSDIVELLSRDPASKRALVTFVGVGDGHVPCINAVHFLLRNGDLTVTYFARGQDIYKKFYADALCIYEMAQKIAGQLGIGVREVQGVISSAHVYLTDLEAIQTVFAAVGVTPGTVTILPADNIISAPGTLAADLPAIEGQA